jgi:SAM-dependent methyltransferase
MFEAKGLNSREGQGLSARQKTAKKEAVAMDVASIERVARLRGSAPVAWTRVERGYTPAERWCLQFADGTSAFAKVGVSPATATWLRTEQAFYAQVRADFVPQCLGFADDPVRPLLLLEDLSSAHWPPPWRPSDVNALLVALGRMAKTPIPKGLSELETDRGRFAGWLVVERDPRPFLSLGLCSREWLAEALPVLLLAQDLASLAGSELVHGDVRSDNLCVLGERVLFVDWNAARRGNAAFDRASLAPSLRLEGGPLPEELAPDEAALAALISGYFAANAGLPQIADAPRVRWIQLRQLRIALPWAVRVLGLPPLDGAWARDALIRLDTELAAGGLAETDWYAATEEIIGDLYLASADPRGQSGKSGDEVEWQWSRELVLDALPPGAGPHHVLDVGCANGYLMESLERWGRERGRIIEPHGLEISPRLAALARARLPRWSERIATGDLLSWAPPRRYDLVHTALDYVPVARRRESLERIARELVSPGGRIVLRAERVQGGQPDLLEQVAELGLEVGGVIERPHPTSGVLRRTVWFPSELRFAR